MRREVMVGVVLLLCGFPCRAADEPVYLVLASAGGATLQGRPVTRGMAIPATASLAVPSGSSVTALGERGKIVVNGAFEGSIASLPVPALRASDPPFGVLASLLMRVLFFVERGGSEEGANLWAIRPDTPGIKCMIAGRPPTLQVTNAMLGRTATIVNPHLDAFAKQALTSKSLAWPSALPVSTGTEYRVSIDGTGKDVSWQLALVDGSGQADEQTLTSMAQRNCIEQLNSYALHLQPTVVVPPTRGR
jgi:hypothetical protein